MRHFREVLRIAFLTIMWLGPGSIMRWRLRVACATRSKIWLDEPATQSAIDQPVRVIKPSRPMTRRDYPQPRYPFAYKTTPHVDNGQNNPALVRPRKVFHMGSYGEAWGPLERVFHASGTWQEFTTSMRVFWQARLGTGRVKSQRIPVKDPARMAQEIKSTAYHFGAELVGITDVTDECIFEGERVPYRYAISIAVPMDRARMLTAPSEAANLAALQGYLDVGRVAIDVAAHIRHLGWDAKAVTTMASAEILHIPLAIKAGLGELGKSGVLITREFGANIRLATVLTNLPMTLDALADLGVADFCALCQLCVRQCPAGAISGEKQMVRGIEKWVTAIDKCAPYFVEYHACGICLEVCPWTERGPRISEMMLHRRSLPPIEERLAEQGLSRTNCAD